MITRQKKINILPAVKIAIKVLHFKRLSSLARFKDQRDRLMASRSWIFKKNAKRSHGGRSRLGKRRPTITNGCLSEREKIGKRVIAPEGISVIYPGTNILQRIRSTRKSRLNNVVVRTSVPNPLRNFSSYVPGGSFTDPLNLKAIGRGEEIPDAPPIPSPHATGYSPVAIYVPVNHNDPLGLLKEEEPNDLNPLCKLAGPKRKKKRAAKKKDVQISKETITLQNEATNTFIDQQNMSVVSPGDQQISQNNEHSVHIPSTSDDSMVQKVTPSDKDNCLCPKDKNNLDNYTKSESLLLDSESKVNLNSCKFDSCNEVKVSEKHVNGCFLAHRMHYLQEVLTDNQDLCVQNEREQKPSKFQTAMTSRDYRKMRSVLKIEPLDQTEIVQREKEYQENLKKECLDLGKSLPKEPAPRTDDSLISPVLRQSKKRHRSVSECPSEGASSSEETVGSKSTKLSNPNHSFSPDIAGRHKIRRSIYSCRNKQWAVSNNNLEPAPVKFSKNPVFKYGNYCRYYGYRTPDLEPDYRLHFFRKLWFEGKDVLDIGCNAGHVTIAIAQFFHPQKVVGMDIDHKLIRMARQNIRTHQTQANLREIKKYPISVTKYGPIESLPALTNPSNYFPKNIMFIQGNYVLERDEQLSYVKAEYDTILALSITKWVHLNHGDDGLKRMFFRIFAHLRPGGRLILEPQPWSSYRRRKKMTETIYNNYNNISLKPHMFTDFLVNQVGFCQHKLIGMPYHPSKGFQRPLHLYTKFSDPSRCSPHHTFALPLEPTNYDAHFLGEEQVEQEAPVDATCSMDQLSEPFGWLPDLSAFTNEWSQSADTPHCAYERLSINERMSLIAGYDMTLVAMDSPSDAVVHSSTGNDDVGGSMIVVRVATPSPYDDVGGSMTAVEVATPSPYDDVGGSMTAVGVATPSPYDDFGGSMTAVGVATPSPYDDVGGSMTAVGVATPSPCDDVGGSMTAVGVATPSPYARFGSEEVSRDIEEQVTFSGAGCETPYIAVEHTLRECEIGWHSNMMPSPMDASPVGFDEYHIAGRCVRGAFGERAGGSMSETSKDLCGDEIEESCQRMSWNRKHVISPRSMSYGSRAISPTRDSLSKSQLLLDEDNEQVMLQSRDQMKFDNVANPCQIECEASELSNIHHQEMDNHGMPVELAQSLSSNCPVPKDPSPDQATVSSSPALSTLSGVTGGLSPPGEVHDCSPKLQTDVGLVEQSPTVASSGNVYFDGDSPS